MKPETNAQQIKRVLTTPKTHGEIRIGKNVFEFEVVSIDCVLITCYHGYDKMTPTYLHISLTDQVLKIKYLGWDARATREFQTDLLSLSKSFFYRDCAIQWSISKPLKVAA